MATHRKRRLRRIDAVHEELASCYLCCILHFLLKSSKKMPPSTTQIQAQHKLLDLRKCSLPPQVWHTVKTAFPRFWGTWVLLQLGPVIPTTPNNQPGCPLPWRSSSRGPFPAGLPHSQLREPRQVGSCGLKLPRSLQSMLQGKPGIACQRKPKCNSPGRFWRNAVDVLAFNLQVRHTWTLFQPSFTCLS